MSICPSVHVHQKMFSKNKKVGIFVLSLCNCQLANDWDWIDHSIKAVFPRLIWHNNLCIFLRWLTSCPRSFSEAGQQSRLLRVLTQPIDLASGLVSHPAPDSFNTLLDPASCENFHIGIRLTFRSMSFMILTSNYGFNLLDPRSWIGWQGPELTRPIIKDLLRFMHHHHHQSIPTFLACLEASWSSWSSFNELKHYISLNSLRDSILFNQRIA